MKIMMNFLIIAMIFAAITMKDGMEKGIRTDWKGKKSPLVHKWWPLRMSTMHW